MLPVARKTPLPPVGVTHPLGYPQTPHLVLACYPDHDILWFAEGTLESTFKMPSDRLRTPEVDELLRALLALEDADEGYAFLLDVCTVREIQDMAQRLQVARMLSAGDHYTDIQRSTGASATTISRVSKSLNYGADGYRSVIDKLEDGRA